jgi:5-methyltetrahydrofolate--homocysteine methyltransferase
LDASRSVPVAGKLSGNAQNKFIEETQKEYDKIREGFLSRSVQKEYLSIDEARKNKFKIDFKKNKPFKPNQLGVFEHQVSVSELKAFIDWTPYFKTWELHGKFPDLLEDELIGEEAKKLYSDTLQILELIENQNIAKPKSVYGIFKANTVEDDTIQLYNEKNKKLSQFISLRQQSKKSKNLPNISLADFIAPKDSGIEDYIGCFAVTAGQEIAEFAKEFEAKNDDYNAIIVKALADRFAEAYAEFLHWKIRKEIWGYAADENLNNEDLIREKYKGIRPAPGYPACPDHLEKLTIWELLDVENRIGVRLTESLAMYPVASVSGYYFAHPETKYFGVGKIKKDQLEDFARRKNITIEKANKWLSSSLSEI